MGKTIVNSGKWPCGVGGKGVQANSVQCTLCKKLIHKWCSGDLSWVADGFRCRRCDGSIQEVGSKRHSLQAVELSQWFQAAVQIVSNLPAPSNGGPIYRFLGMPAMRTRWMAGAAAHKSG